MKFQYMVVYGIRGMESFNLYNNAFEVEFESTDLPHEKSKKMLEAAAGAHNAQDGFVNVTGRVIYLDIVFQCVVQLLSPNMTMITLSEIEQMRNLLDRAEMLVGNPGTNISGSCDVACDNWQKDYKKWKLS